MRERQTWTRERVLDAAKEWEARYGAPPGAADWNPSLARRRGQPDRVEAFEAGTYPHVTTVRRFWSTWNEFIEDAGFTPRPRGGQTHRLSVGGSAER